MFIAIILHNLTRYTIVSLHYNENTITLLQKVDYFIEITVYTNITLEYFSNNMIYIIARTFFYMNITKCLSIIMKLQMATEKKNLNFILTLYTTSGWCVLLLHFCECHYKVGLIITTHCCDYLQRNWVLVIVLLQ